MYTFATTETDQTISIKPSAPWRVTEVVPEVGYRLRVTFMDGLNGVVDLREWLHEERVDGTIFERLREEAFFCCATVVQGVVVWPNGADLAPDVMYDSIRLEASR